MLSLLYGPNLKSIHDYQKNYSFVYGPLSSKRYLCFIIHCLGLSSFPFKEQSSFNFMATVTICSDFGAQENKMCHCFVLLNLGLKNFEHYLASMWDECSCAGVWVFFSIAFLWDWSENGPFPVLWPLLSFPILLAHSVSRALSQVFRFEIAQPEFHHLH